MWSLETLEAINKEAYRRASKGLPERDALFAIIDPRFRKQESQETRIAGEMEDDFHESRNA